MQNIEIFQKNPFAKLSMPDAPAVEPETIPDRPQEDAPPERAPVEPTPFNDPAEQPGHCPDPSTCPMP
jgi:hypothetical protein